MKPYDKPELIIRNLAKADVLTASQQEVSQSDTLAPWDGTWDRV